MTSSGRLRLQPGLRLLWRGPGSLQIGLTSEHGICFSGLLPGEEHLLAALEDGVELDEVEHVRRLAGLSPNQLAALIERVRAAHLLESEGGPALWPHELTAQHCGDARILSVVRPDGDGWGVLTARSAAVVAVLGRGRLASIVVAGLAGAGVGTVMTDDSGTVRPDEVSGLGYRRHDIGLARTIAAARVVDETVSAPVTASMTTARPQLAIVVDHGVADPVRAEDLAEADITYLSVVVRETDVVVGPLVRPRRSVCVRCLDLHRTDADPLWPRMAAQVRGSAWADNHAEESVLAVSGAALAISQILAEIDGLEPATVNRTFELRLPDALPAPTAWTTHPDCGCTWLGPAR